MKYKPRRSYSYISLVHVEPFFVSVVVKARFLFVLIWDVNLSPKFLEYNKLWTRQNLTSERLFHLHLLLVI